MRVRDASAPESLSYPDQEGKRGDRHFAGLATATTPDGTDHDLPVSAMPRLTTALRARAIMRLVESRGGFAAVLRHGDDSAGDLLVRVNAPHIDDPAAPPVEIYAPATAPDGGFGWVRMGRPGYTDAAAADAAVARALDRDPDLWVLELDPGGPGFPLAEPLLDASAGPDADPAHAAAEALFRRRSPAGNFR